MPGPLDELHHADALAAPKHAQRQSKRGGGFAFAGPGMDNQQTLLDRLGRDFRILHGFTFGHFGAMPLGFDLIVRLTHFRT